MENGKEGVWRITSLLATRSTAITSCATQLQNHKRSMCQRGDSPNARPVISVCAIAAEVSFDGITTSLELLRAISRAFFRHLAQIDDAHVGAAVSKEYVPRTLAFGHL